MHSKRSSTCLTARYYAHTAEEYLRAKRRHGVQLMLTKVWEHHHPKRLVGIISPWNYPLTLGISDALPAIVAGNAILAKPDDRTPFSHLWAVRLLEEAGMPPGLIQSVTGPGSELGAPIIDQSDYLMFTGSTAVGRTVATKAAERLIEFSMELRGKNALLVLDAPTSIRRSPARGRRSTPPMGGMKASGTGRRHGTASSNIPSRRRLRPSMCCRSVRRDGSGQVRTRVS
jgi:acyl-CoA reductase-like NAD-dependent aldehyde dehydrogenase